MSRRKLRMTTTNAPCKWSLTIFCLHLLTHRAKPILWIIQLHTHMIRRRSNSIPNYSNSIYRICPTMRTNSILRCNRNYKPSISISICGKGSSSMSMGGIRGSKPSRSEVYFIHYFIVYLESNLLRLYSSYLMFIGPCIIAIV